MGSMVKTVLKTTGCAVLFLATVAGIGALVITQAPSLERKVRNHV